MGGWDHKRDRAGRRSGDILTSHTTPKCIFLVCSPTKTVVEKQLQTCSELQIWKHDFNVNFRIWSFHLPASLQTCWFGGFFWYGVWGFFYF